ncbi:hypothetical protein L2E82_26368 [Cichorium intybus]|uniref:Uncharacterized protein n=1 Tax=Cichorium intybus TaxID=13427 RepID=A0ACB9CQM7_CICIN|nr:hypothetical protein L1887_44442 [Cichorium endivia]KAI3736535.1 hypothetical protein L2E82_26368 [Cichorium intybus]
MQLYSYEKTHPMDRSAKTAFNFTSSVENRERTTLLYKKQLSSPIRGLTQTHPPTEPFSLYSLGFWGLILSHINPLYSLS